MALPAPAVMTVGTTTFVAFACKGRGVCPSCNTRRIMRTIVGRGLLESCDAKDMLAYAHSGFSVDAGVCIEAHDRAGRSWTRTFAGAL